MGSYSDGAKKLMKQKQNFKQRGFTSSRGFERTYDEPTRRYTEVREFESSSEESYDRDYDTRNSKETSNNNRDFGTIKMKRGPDYNEITIEGDSTVRAVVQNINISNETKKIVRPKTNTNRSGSDKDSFRPKNSASRSERNDDKGYDREGTDTFIVRDNYAKTQTFIKDGISISGKPMSVDAAIEYVQKMPDTKEKTQILMQIKKTLERNRESSKKQMETIMNELNGNKVRETNEK